MNDAPSPEIGPTAIRSLSVDDLPEICRLLSQRDERDWDLPSLRWFLQDLDPARCRAWGAFDNDRAVGLTNYFFRTLTAEGGETVQAAYWANLYIDPAYRSQMLYPRLPMTMLRDVAKSDAQFLYAAVRLQQVAQAHRGLQFAEIGQWHVLARLVRPGRLGAKYLSLPAWARWWTVPCDYAYGWVAGLTTGRGRNRSVNDLSYAEAPLERIAALLQRRSESRRAQQWTVERVQERYRQTRERGEYRFVTIEGPGPADAAEPALQAAVIYRLAERGNGIQAAIVMDVVYAPNCETQAKAALRRLAGVARERDCEVILYLDGLGHAVRDLAAACGFRGTRERYTLMVQPKKILDEQPRLADHDAWAFVFGDHDAF